MSSKLKEDTSNNMKSVNPGSTSIPPSNVNTILPGAYEVPKGYEIDFEEDVKYQLKVGLSKLKKLKITVLEISKYNSIYEAKFDHQELIQIDRFFGLFETIEDIVKEIDNLLVKNLVTISLDMNHNVLMEIQITINNKPRIIKLKLIKRGSEESEALNNLCDLVQAQTRKLDSLQQENQNLKAEMGRLNERLENLKNKGYGQPENFVKPDESEMGKSKGKSKKDDSFSFSEAEKKKEEFNIDDIVAESSIIESMKDVQMLIKKINEIFDDKDKEFGNLKKLYSASEDGDSPSMFHSQCDGICPLLVFIKTTKGRKFGGFTQAPFESCTTYKGKIDNSAFIFSIDKQKTYDVEQGKNAICTYKNYGPVFYGYEYCNIYLIGNFLKTKGNVAKKNDRYKTNEDYEINFGEQKFLTEELEVYQVILKDSEVEKVDGE